jgi:hypothetical protein
MRVGKAHRKKSDFLRILHTRGGANFYPVDFNCKITQIHSSMGEVISNKCGGFHPAFGGSCFFFSGSSTGSSRGAEREEEEKCAKAAREKEERPLDSCYCCYSTVMI